MKFSEDGGFMAYELASGGSDWHTMRIMRIDAATGFGTDLDEALQHIKFSTTAWTHDNKVAACLQFSPHWPPCTHAIRGAETSSTSTSLSNMHFI